MKKNLLTAFGFLAALASAAQDCSDLIISEYVEGTNNNKAIELYNASSQPINLGTTSNPIYAMGRERNGNAIPMLLPITGIIEPYQTKVFVLDKTDPNAIGVDIAVFPELLAVADTLVNPDYVESNSPFYFNGDDAFYLVKNNSVLIDMIGKTGEDPGGGWAVPGDPNTRWWTEDNTLIRKQSVLRGVSVSPSVFDPSLEWDSLQVNTFTNLGFHLCDCESSNVKDRNPKSSFEVFPNPFQGGSLVLKSAAKMVAFTLVNANGQVVREREFINSNYQTIELPEVAPGMYMILMEFEDGSRNYQKLMYK
ncbi:MAG: lamin tail domain-containing protein [Flavobacteriales bacterium]|jgi:hypothetical protein